MAVYNIHAGHGLDGKIGCGAVGLIKESTEARKVKDEVIRLLKADGHTVYDCTVDNGTSQSDILKKIVAKCNNHKVDLDVSIHFNAGASDKTGNDKTTGTEVLIYSADSKAKDEAERICKEISSLGFKNRGVKVNSKLYVLKNTNSPALLVECLFLDDEDDVELYNYKTMAKAIVQGILNKKLTATTTPPILTENTPKEEFKVKIIVDSLKIRKGAGTGYTAVGTVHKGEVFTIVKTSNHFGKLKSGAGWISIKNKYVKRIN